MNRELKKQLKTFDKNMTLARRVARAANTPFERLQQIQNDIAETAIHVQDCLNVAIDCKHYSVEDVAALKWRLSDMEALYQFCAERMGETRYG